ncbi:uncharacterized protein TRIADDRAFT_64159 [Trichoplax adhaerens]|uniref:X-box-binding protein 1 n=1 Tax=Trichoplax adhaerens TaxID=10228 RepID=B3S4E1_TRIAD|nr:hypothetical protein TRIADDRAFT_64159 [Trichoplax adhaerens]EDV22623.1 hypothetical protein TRIADDRAFT_64159 [Trichoplax adhaerens]|eukprot:XP_002115167.1 hypothetical protein TRIADDRAFT_64159 [Trichoplax adhaerens]
MEDSGFSDSNTCNSSCNSEDIPSPVRRKRKRNPNLTPEERRFNRKIKNRIAAQAARDKKKELMNYLESNVDVLRNENQKLRNENDMLKIKIEQLSQENSSLKSESEIVLATMQEYIEQCDLIDTKDLSGPVEMPAEPAVLYVSPQQKRALLLYLYLVSVIMNLRRFLSHSIVLLYPERETIVIFHKFGLDNNEYLQDDTFADDFTSLFHTEDQQSFNSKNDVPREHITSDGYLNKFSMELEAVMQDLAQNDYDYTTFIAPNSHESIGLQKLNYDGSVNIIR